MPPVIQTLEAVLTGACNLRCSYCYQNQKKARRMSWDTLRSALDLLLRSPERDVSVVFLGGEPLLRFDLIRQAVAYVRTASPRKRVRCSVITNGTLLGDEQAAFLSRHRFDVQLSFDGVPAVQERRGPRTFSRLDGLLDRLRSERPAFFRNRLTIGMTLTAAAIPHLAESVAYFLGKGVAALAVAPVITHDPGWKHESRAVLEEQFARVYRLSLRHYRRTGEVPFLAFRRNAPEADRVPRGDAVCAAPSGRNLAVDVDGQAYGCAGFAESYQSYSSVLLREGLEAVRMGNVLDAGVGERPTFPGRSMRGDALFHGRGEKYSSYGRCGECRFLDECSICPVSIGHVAGNTDPRRVPDFACAYNLVSLAWRARFPAQPTALDLLTGRVRAYGPLREVQKRLAPAVTR